MAGTLNFEPARKVDAWIGTAICAVLFAWSRVRAMFGGPPQPALRATTPPDLDRPVPPPRRVLAIKFYGLGNMVMVMPVLGALRRAYPNVQIDFMTIGANASVLERSGCADDVIPVEVTDYSKLLGSVWRALRTLWVREYDVVLDFEQFIKLSTILGFLSGAPGYVIRNRDEPL